SDLATCTRTWTITRSRWNRCSNSPAGTSTTTDWATCPTRPSTRRCPGSRAGSSRAGPGSRNPRPPDARPGRTAGSGQVLDPDVAVGEHVGGAVHLEPDVAGGEPAPVRARVVRARRDEVLTAGVVELVDQHTVAEDRVVLALHPDLVVVPGALLRPARTGQAHPVEAVDRARLVHVAGGGVEHLDLVPELDGGPLRARLLGVVVDLREPHEHTGVGVRRARRVVTPLELQREVAVLPLGEPQHAEPAPRGARGDGPVLVERERTAAHVLPLAEGRLGAVEDRAVAVGLAGRPDPGLTGGPVHGPVLPLVDDPLLLQTVQHGPHVLEEQRLRGPLLLVLDQLTD